MAENENQAKLCRTTWNNLEGLYIAYCGNVLSTHVRVRTRSTMQICEVAVLGRWKAVSITNISFASSWQGNSNVFP